MKYWSTFKWNTKRTPQREHAQSLLSREYTSEANFRQHGGQQMRRRQDQNESQPQISPYGRTHYVSDSNRNRFQHPPHNQHFFLTSYQPYDTHQKHYKSDAQLDSWTQRAQSVHQEHFQERHHYKEVSQSANSRSFNSLDDSLKNSESYRSGCSLIPTLSQQGQNKSQSEANILTNHSNNLRYIGNQERSQQQWNEYEFSSLRLHNKKERYSSQVSLTPQTSPHSCLNYLSDQDLNQRQYPSPNQRFFQTSYKTNDADRQHYRSSSNLTFQTRAQSVHQDRFRDRHDDDVFQSDNFDSFKSFDDSMEHSERHRSEFALVPTLSRQEGDKFKSEASLLANHPNYFSDCFGAPSPLSNLNNHCAFAGNSFSQFCASSRNNLYASCASLNVKLDVEKRSSKPRNNRSIKIIRSRDVNSLDRIYNQFLLEEAELQASLSGRVTTRQGYITINQDAAAAEPMRISSKFGESQSSLAQSEQVSDNAQLMSSSYLNLNADNQTHVSVHVSRRIQRSTDAIASLSQKPVIIKMENVPLRSRSQTPTNQPLHIQTDFRTSRQSSITSERSVPAAKPPIIVPIKPFHVEKPKFDRSFRIRDVRGGSPANTWKPDEKYSSNQSLNQYPEEAFSHDAPRDPNEPRMFYWELMNQQRDKIPGMLDPLIIDDTQGDFLGNPLVRPEKNLYADSAFYDTKDHQYPTIPEQMSLCKSISDVLLNPQSMKSRGGKMFHKRRNKAPEWTREAMGRRNEREYDGYNGYYEYGQYGEHYWPSSMKSKLVCDDLERLEHNTENLSKHDYLPPVVAFCVNTALLKESGKAREIFARNKERADQYIVDEDNRKRIQHPNTLTPKLEVYSHFSQYKSPWDAAVEGNIERAFRYLDPCAAQSVRDEPWLRKDENSHILEFDHQKAIFGVKYKDVQHVEPPKPGSKEGATATTLKRARELSQSLPSGLNHNEPRLATLIKRFKEQEPTFDTYSYKWCEPSYGGRNLLDASVGERYGFAHQPGWYTRPQEFSQTAQSWSDFGGSSTDLRRPKEFIKAPTYDVYLNESMSSLPLVDPHMLPPISKLSRPRDFMSSDYLPTQYATQYQAGRAGSVASLPTQYSTEPVTAF